MPRTNRATPHWPPPPAADNLESVKLLLAKGAGADVPDGQGYTPLSWAASNCNLEAVKLFLSKGANVNAANTSGGEVKFGKIQLIKLTPLMMASTYCCAGRGQDPARCGRQGERRRHSRDDADPVRGLLRGAESGSREAAAQGGRGRQRQEFRGRDGSRLGEEVRQQRSHRRAHSRPERARECPTPRRSSSRPASGPSARPWKAAPRFCSAAPRSSSSNPAAWAVITSRWPRWRLRRRAAPASTWTRPPRRAS